MACVSSSEGLGTNGLVVVRPTAPKWRSSNLEGAPLADCRADTHIMKRAPRAVLVRLLPRGAERAAAHVPRKGCVPPRCGVKVPPLARASAPDAGSHRLAMWGHPMAAQLALNRRGRHLRSTASLPASTLFIRLRTTVEGFRTFCR